MRSPTDIASSQHADVVYRNGEWCDLALQALQRQPNGVRYEVAHPGMQRDPRAALSAIAHRHVEKAQRRGAHDRSRAAALLNRLARMSLRTLARGSRVVGRGESGVDESHCQWCETEEWMRDRGIFPVDDPHAPSEGSTKTSPGHRSPCSSVYGTPKPSSSTQRCSSVGSASPSCSSSAARTPSACRRCQESSWIATIEHETPER